MLAQENLATSSTSPNRVLWQLTDNIGSVRALANNSGAVASWTDTENVVHYAYANYAEFGLPDEATTQVASVFGTRYLFTSKERDPITGLQLNLHRWYDPDAKRWTGEDPIWDDKVNTFRYVVNGPLNATDPTGLQPRMVGLIWYGRPELEQRGVTPWAINNWERLGYHMGGLSSETALGLKPNHYKVESRSYRAMSGEMVAGVKVTDCDTKNVWYGVPEIVFTYKNAEVVDYTYKRDHTILGYYWGEEPVLTGTAQMGWSYYARESDALWSLTGGEKLKAMRHVAAAYGIAGGAAQGYAAFKSMPNGSLAAPRLKSIRTPHSESISGTFSPSAPPPEIAPGGTPPPPLGGVFANKPPIPDQWIRWRPPGTWGEMPTPKIGPLKPPFYPDGPIPPLPPGGMPPISPN